MQRDLLEREKEHDRDSAELFIQRWRQNLNDREYQERQISERLERREKIVQRARDYLYCYVHDFVGAKTKRFEKDLDPKESDFGKGPGEEDDAGESETKQESFAYMFLRDELGKIDIELCALDLRAAETCSEAVEMLEMKINEKQMEYLNRGEERKRVRLIGTSVGAFACVAYASKLDEDEKNGRLNVSVVDRLFLLGPVFDVEKCLFKYRATFSGVTFSEKFIEDAKKLDKFPFVTCPAYIVAGADDKIADLEDALHWTRQASTLLRATSSSSSSSVDRKSRSNNNNSRTDNDDDDAIDNDQANNNSSSSKVNQGREAGERRLLEVSGVGHRVESALPHALPRFKEFFGIPKI